MKDEKKGCVVCVRKCGVVVVDGFNQRKEKVTRSSLAVKARLGNIWWRERAASPKKSSKR